MEALKGTVATIRDGGAGIMKTLRYIDGDKLKAGNKKQVKD